MFKDLTKWLVTPGRERGAMSAIPLGLFAVIGVGLIAFAIGTVGPGQSAENAVAAASAGVAVRPIPGSSVREGGEVECDFTDPAIQKILNDMQATLVSAKSNDTACGYGLKGSTLVTTLSGDPMKICPAATVGIISQASAVAGATATDHPCTFVTGVSDGTVVERFQSSLAGRVYPVIIKDLSQLLGPPGSGGLLVAMPTPVRPTVSANITTDGTVFTDLVKFDDGSEFDDLTKTDDVIAISTANDPSAVSVNNTILSLSQFALELSKEFVQIGVGEFESPMGNIVLRSSQGGVTLSVTTGTGTNHYAMNMAQNVLVPILPPVLGDPPTPSGATAVSALIGNLIAEEVLQGVSFQIN